MKHLMSGGGRERFIAPLAVLLSLALPAAGGTLHSTYIDPPAMALQRVLPPPPEAGSEAAKADTCRPWKPPSELAHPPTSAASPRDLPCTLDRFGGVLGPAFTAETMPVTAALIERVFQDGELAVLAAKAAIARPRPYTLKPDLATFGHRSDSTSYPSGHATFGYLAATVLSRLVPESARRCSRSPRPTGRTA
ncbi:phosphatase PAP2 family protein [Methylobacterium oryzae CBMB20]